MAGFDLPDDTIALNPACGGYYCNRGHAEFSLNLLSESLSDYNKAVQLDPKNSQGYYNRGILEATGLTNFTAAVEDFTKAIDLHSDPREADIFFWRGNARLQAGDYNGAIADYDRAMALNPNARYAADLKANLALARKTARSAGSNQLMQPAPR